MVIPTLRKTLLDGNLVGTKENAVGIYRGFPIIIEHDNNADEFTIEMNAASVFDEDNQELNLFWQGEKLKNPSILLIEVRHYRIFITVKPPLWANQKTEMLNSTIDTFIDYLIANNYYGCCPACGNTVEIGIDCYEFDTTNVFSCEECIPKIVDRMEKRKKDIRSQKSNYGKGMLGALLAGLLGCALYIFMYNQGIIKGAVGFLIGKLCLNGYVKLGKGFDFRGAISCVIMMLVMIFISNHIGWVMTDMQTDYWKNLVFVYFTTFVASAQPLYNAVRGTTGNYSFKKIDL